MPRPLSRAAGGPLARVALRRTLALLLGLAATLAQAAGDMRLPGTVRPLAYHLSLTVDPARPQHGGTVDIDVELAQPARSIQLHARDLRLADIWLDSGARRHAAKARPLDAERVELRFAQPVPAGRGRLHLAFSGRLQDMELAGLFRRQEAGRWYAYTQFQATDARRAFPLFDEPGWKVPWTLSLTVPQGLVALGNTPPRGEQPATPGWTRIDFEPTPPLPSYLLAFAVGPFELLEAPPAGPVPLRIVAPQGRAAEGAYAAAMAPRLVQRLEAYFDLPLPFAKLDQVAIADTATFGAMEHVGLVTYAAPLLLATPSEATGHFQREHVSLAAHELAHQWFGNLVTMRWWDDLWLNESFASWLGDRVAAELVPDGHGHASVPRARARAMRADRLPSARRIQQPVRSDDDLGSVWDAITYEKGQVVLAMFEQWLGPERFRDGVRRYIHRHAWGSAGSDDFFAALGTQDAALPAAMRSFTQQPGTPRVAVELLCEDGPPRLRLAQSRLLPLAEAGAASPLWQVPMLIATPGGLTRHLLHEREAELALPDAECPPWVQANVGGRGYYRALYSPLRWQRLMERPDLPVPEVLAGLDDALGLSEAGDLPLAGLLAMAEHFAGHADATVVTQAAQLLLATTALIDSQDEAARAAQVARWQRAFGERARQLGWQARAGEHEDDHALRARLLPALARHGEDAGLRSDARARVRAWLEGGPALDPALRAGLLATAALDGDEALFDALLAASRQERDSARRFELLAALGHFSAPRLADRARALLLAPGTDLHEAAPAVMGAHNQVPALREGLLRFLQARRVELARRLGRDGPARLPRYLDRACSEDEARRIEAAFAPQAARHAGGRLALAQALEQVRSCAAWAGHEARRR